VGGSRRCRPPRHPTDRLPLSVRSITTIIAGRLADAARADRLSPATLGPERANTTARWGEDDHARVVAERKAATERLASYEDLLDEADTYAETILQRLEANLAGSRDAPHGGGLQGR